MRAHGQFGTKTVSLGDGPLADEFLVTIELADGSCLSHRIEERGAGVGLGPGIFAPGEAIAVVIEFIDT